MRCRTAALILLALAAPWPWATGSAGEVTVAPSPGLQRAVERARSEFLASQPFDRFHVTVLVEDRPGRWLRGSVEGDALSYPASCVKLGFLVGAVHWCRSRGERPDCLDLHARPMIVDSDNVATGELVDAISGVPNQTVGTAALPAADVEAWIDRRRYTERLLDTHGLLGGQRLLTKTYPTNSGETPVGLEEVARLRLGRNAMSADLSARLMLAIQTGSIEPQAQDYMRALLRRPAMSPHSSLGGGLPPGSRHENKLGVAFDTLEDIMYAELPNRRRLIVAAYSNGLDPSEPEPWDAARLGRFTELLIRAARLDAGLPLPAFLPAHAQPPASRLGEWRQAESRSALSSGGFLISESGPGASVQWHLGSRRGGRYEVAVWYPAQAGNTRSAEFIIDHADGSTRIELDQSTWGARWIRLGDFRFDARAPGTVTLRNSGTGALVADSLRVTRWRD